MAKTTNDFDLVQESGVGKKFNTGDDKIQVLQLQGSWREMGRQYGTFAKDGMQQVWDSTVQPILDKKWTTESEAEALFGRRVFDASSIRMKELTRGVADATGWSIDKVSLHAQGQIMGIYQGKLHSFSGCSSILAWGSATADGAMVTARNMDWGESFLAFPLYFTVFNPTDGSNGFANLGWPGWLWVMSALNDKGVYMDLHDGTSMGGSVAYVDRGSFLNSMFDVMAECDHAEAVSDRMNSLRNDLSWIWTVADATPNGFSYECPQFDSRRRNPAGDTLAVVNSFMIDDWGIHRRETLSNSIRRYENLTARLAEAHGKIDSDKAMDIFDLTLFNEDGTFRENGGVTKPTKQDADLTDHQIVTRPSELEVWLKIPLRTEWRHVDLKTLFTG